MARTKVARRALARHKPAGVTHIYYSERVDGSKAYEVRHPRQPGTERRLYEVIGSGKGALARAKARANEVHGLQGGPLPVSVATTLADVIEAWRTDAAPKLKPRTRESYERTIRLRILPSFGRMRVRDITVLVIIKWLDGLTRKDGEAGQLSTGTKAGAYAVLKALLGHAVLIGAIPTAPSLPRGSAPTHSAPRKRMLTPEEDDRLIAWIESGRRKWLGPIVDVALGQALRLGEVCGLDWADLDFGASTVTVRHNLGKDGILGSPKGNKEATITLTERTRKALLPLRQRWMEAGRPSEGPVFTNTYGEHRQPRDVQRAFAQAVERAGLAGTDVVFHSLRHTAISRLANNPAIPLVAVRDFARHSSLMITQGYMHDEGNAVVTDAIKAAV